MKKNILTIVIMAASLINLILMIVLVFTVMPAMNKTSNLIDKVSSVIDLEIESEKEDEPDYTIQDLEPYVMEYDSSVNVNLQKDAGDKDNSHFAVFSGATLFFNPNEEDYSTVLESIQKTSDYVDDIIRETLGEYTAATISEAAVKDKVVKKLQEAYNTKSIVEVTLKGFLVS